MRSALGLDVGKNFQRDESYIINGERFSVGRIDPSPTFPIITLHWIGDSNGNGSDTDGTGYSGGWRKGMESYLRSLRSDFDFVGSHITMPEGCSQSLVWNDTIPGQGLIAAATNFPTWVSDPAVGVANFTLDALGANDIATGASFSDLVNRRKNLNAVYDQYAQARLGSIIFAVQPFGQGTGVGGNFAAWNALATQYNTFLQGYCNSKADQGYVFYNPYTLTTGEFQTDGIHADFPGQGEAGQNEAVFVDRVLTMVNGARYGARLPRAFNQRQWSGSISVAGAGQGLSVVNHPGFNPGASSFALFWDLYPTSLPGGTLNVLEYGQYNVTDFFLIQSNGQDLLVYWNNIGGNLFPGVGGGQSTGGGTLTVNKWARCGLIVHAPSGSIGLYVNGQLVGCAKGLSAWNFAQRTMTFGKGPTGNAQQGYYSNILAFSGANVPRPGSMAAQVAVERDLYLGGSVAPQNVVASFRLSTNLIDNISGNPAMTLVGGATQVTAYPGTTPVRPWEYQG